MNRQTDTIAAISTPAGSGAIAMVRLSGPESISIVDQIFTTSKKKTDLATQKANTTLFGKIIDGERILDEVVVSLFRAPNSYTGEDLVEIHCHGSSYIQQELLALILRTGARMAQPGEFTQRAFMNDKMDLSQAEAVADLIASSGKASHKLAMDQLKGGFSKELELLRIQMLDFVSLVELELDFSEEDVEFADRTRLTQLLESIDHQVTKLSESFELGNTIKKGIPVAIVGETNVGKSTLLNALLKEEKAIVSEIAGTTRDVIEDCIHLEGVEFRFIDTAGLRHTEDTIENLGIERSYQQIKKARIVLLVVDPTAPKQQSQLWLDRVVSHMDTDQQFIIVINKVDKSPDEALIRERFIQSTINNQQSTILSISAKTGQGIDQLISTLLQSIHLEALEGNDVIVTNVRHYESLLRTHEALIRAINGLATGISGDFLSQDIREAMHYLGEITGIISTDEILRNIFGKFCIGK